MLRAEALVQKMEQRGFDLIPSGGGLSGTWKVLVPEYKITGVMTLHQDGTLMSGGYKMSTGAQGSLRGTYAGGELRLEMINSERGLVGASQGTLDAESREIAGKWQPLEFGTGGPSLVTWSALRISIEDLFAD